MAVEETLALKECGFALRRALGRGGCGRGLAQVV